MLHVHNGDVSAQGARQQGVPGRHVAFREALSTGPTPATLSDETWVETRTTFLAQAYEEDREKCRAEYRAMLGELDAISDGETVVLHFDDDMFCQVNMMFVVHRVYGAGAVGELCYMNEKRPLSNAELSGYVRAWEAYTSSDPRNVEALARSGTLPSALQDALKLHLSRFPSSRDGLAETERTLLDILTAGPLSFLDVFRAFSRRAPDYGSGDHQVWLELQRLAGSQPAAVHVQAEAHPLRRGTFMEARVELTALGRELLQGGADFLAHAAETWLGGARVGPPRTSWRRDDDGNLVLPS
ncbi:MAG: DUF1835 domain-containing protein [Myxococcota bacterium]